jgi:hypothetical protein
VNAFLAAETADGHPHEHKSLRQLSREIGYAPTGLKKFAAGAEPYRPHFRMLRAWYGGVMKTDDESQIGLAVGILAGYFPDREQASRDLRAEFERLRAQHVLEVAPTTKRPAPRWAGKDICLACGETMPMGELRAHIQEKHGGALMG